MKPEILFEDDYLLAVNKPSGMVANRGFGAEGDTLQDWVDSSCDFPLAHNDQARNGIVHRLDKETSGVILIAKTQEVLGELQKQFKERNVQKTYVALVHGKLELEKGIADAPLGRNPKVRTKFSVIENGRDAVTEYKLVTSYLSPAVGETLSLVEFSPKTGRTHQIRVHAKHLGHPIVSDYLYAGRKTTRNDRKWCPRLFLHAQKIVFAHPVGGQSLTIQAPLPADLENVLNPLDKSA